MGASVKEKATLSVNRTTIAEIVGGLSAESPAVRAKMLRRLKRARIAGSVHDELLDALLASADSHSEPSYREKVRRVLKAITPDR